MNTKATPTPANPPADSVVTLQNEEGSCASNGGSAQDAKCKACHGDGYTNEGDPEIGNAYFACEKCGGSGKLPATTVRPVQAVDVAAELLQAPGAMPSARTATTPQEPSRGMTDEEIDNIAQQHLFVRADEDNDAEVIGARPFARAVESHIVGGERDDVAAAERTAAGKRVWDERITVLGQIYNADGTMTMWHKGDWTLGYLSGLERAYRLVLSMGVPYAYRALSDKGGAQ